MKKYFIVISLLSQLFYVNLMAQELPNIIPPSPNAATLGEYGNTPISLTTGTPNISIPLWEIKGKNISLPISISYRASGIKIEDQGSNIGIGWALNAGGVITRSIKGRPDEGIIASTGKYFPFRQENLPFNMDSSSLSSTIAPNISDISSTIDTEPDLFNYNFGLYSGKFVFDNNGIAKVMPDTQFKIKYPGSEAKIEITDLQGVKYFFDETESTNTHPTSWYLTKIVSANGLEEISFEYALEQFSYWMPARRTTFVDFSITNDENISEQNVYLNALRLTKINTNFGVSVDLISGSSRIDYNISTSSNIPKSISEIIIKYNNKCIKKFVFDNEFIETDKPFSSTHYLWDFYDMSWANKRMYLKGIVETSCNNSISKTHHFEYWGRLSNGKDSLANKLSYAQDHWGYYNGKNNNSSLRPFFTGDVPYPGVTNNLSDTKTIPGADRASYFPWSRCGTLKSITYPTGGKSIFEYDPNYGYHEVPGNIEAGGLRISKIINFDINGNIIKTKRFEYEGGIIVDYPDYTNSNRFFLFPDNNLSNYYPDFSSLSIGNPLYNYRKLIIQSGNVNGISTTNGYHIDYRKVKEIEDGNGFILNIYNCAKETLLGDYIDTYYMNENDSYNNLTQKYYIKMLQEIQEENPISGWTWYSSRGGWPYAPKTDNSWKRGLLMEQHYYREGAGSPFKSIINEYTYSNLDPVYGLTWKVENTGNESDQTNTGRGNLFFYGNYKIQYGVAKLTKQTITENGVTRIINSEYDDYHMLSKTTETSSDVKTLETTYKYPTDFSLQAPYSNMVAKNIISPVIEKDVYSETNLLSKLKNNYKDWGNNVIELENIQTLKGTNTLDDRIQYQYDNSNGNMKEVSKADDTHIVYIWGYEEQYPIAKIENATYSQVSSQVSTFQGLSNSDDDHCLDSGTCNEKDLRDALASLRSLLPNAMVTTYTYDPLVGVTSITDPKGYTTYYEYDDFNRLKQVKDANGKLLSKNEYHYKGQQ